LAAYSSVMEPACPERQGPIEPRAMAIAARNAACDQAPAPSSAPVAALPMYDLPELADVHAALWAAIRARLTLQGMVDTPAMLAHPAQIRALWTDPRLLLGQTCGYVLETRLQGRVRLIATPRYRAHGCDGPFHRGAVLVRAGEAAECLSDLRGARCGLNDPASNVGMNLLRAEVAPLARGEAFFGSVVATGPGEAGALAVAEGRVDLACLDCVTWALLQRLRPRLARELRVLMWTTSSPGPPLVTSRLTEARVVAALGRALDDIARDPALQPVRAELLLEGFNRLPLAYYRAVLHLEHIAADQGYPELR
jgi:ABC-type phosphate/phosphonate transport system substrate-binding protein